MMMDEEYETEDIPVGDYGSDLEIDSDDGDMSLGGPEDMESTDRGSAQQGVIPRNEQVQMIHMRRYLDNLADRVMEKDYLVQKTREEQKKCREQIQNLEIERDTIYTRIEEAEDENNVASGSRLRAQHRKLCEEIENEEEIEQQIQIQLDKAEYDLAQAQVEQGKLILAEAELQDREEQWGEQRTDQAIKRSEKETKYARHSEKRRAKMDRQRASALEEQERRREHTIREAKRSHEYHNKYLKQTLTKLQQREKDEEERQKSHTEKRVNTMLALKADITANRENLRALQARDKAVSQREKEKETQQTSVIVDRGGNPAEEMLKHKKFSDFEREKHNKELRDQARDEAIAGFYESHELHRQKQRENEVKIAEQILDEERRIEQRKKQQPNLWKDPKNDKTKHVKAHKKRKLQAFELYMQQNEGSLPVVEPPQRQAIAEGRGLVDSDEEEGNVNTDDVRSVQALTGNVNSDSEGEIGDDLAKPEFEGLWDQHKPYTVPKDVDRGPTLPGATKMEKNQEEEILLPWERKEDPNEERKMRIRKSYESKQKEMMQRVLNKHRKGIVIKQVAGGKEFKGQAFYSKPDVIHFKDFDVGKQYKCKVTLTNVSYTVNYCKLIGITEHLKDFIDVHFDPPGQMSAGLTCEMLVTFKPMINEDLDGQVNFLAQTGPFAIPIVCSTKKCDLKVDKTVIDFGTAVIGETLKRTFTLTNDGALGTRFEFVKITGLKQRTETTAETSLGRLTATDTIRGVSPVSDVFEKGKGKEKLKGKEEKKGPENAEEAGDQDEEQEHIMEEDTHTEENTDDDEEGEDEPVAEEEGGDTEREGEEGEDLASIDDNDSEIPMSEMDDMNLDGLSVGTFSAGEIGPFSSVRLEILWQPTIPGRVDTEFMFSFTDPLSDNISVQGLAHAVDVPVWVERQNVDLKICMYDRLYQDTIIVNNRATTALRLKFEVCKELRNHMELLPKTGYIQAQSQFSAQLKFLPRKSLMEEGSKYFDKETGVLQAPMVITVADQTRPVPFTVHAIVTTSDMSFSTNDIDFGKGTIYESVKHTVQLTNHSILPQKFGFVGLPEYIDVQPNDGFGTLLPLETVDLDIIFKPPKAREYNFELTCKSLINREFKIKCCGVGVHPPLDLSKQVIHFAASAMNDISLATLHVVNSHISSNEFTHPVPRIGKGEIAPVGPTSFEFVVPEGAPLTVSPSVGTVIPGEKTKIEVRFSPRLDEAAIRKECVRMVTKQAEARAAEEYKAQLKREKEMNDQAATQPDKKAAGGKAKGKGSPKGRGKVDPNAGLVVSGPPQIKVPTEEEVEKSSDEYAAAQASLLRQCKGKFDTFIVPCYVASGKCGNPGTLDYSIHNTLYLEVHCPAKKPELVVISDNGRTMTNFGDVSIGQSVIKSITIQNISNRYIDMTSSILDTAGPFQMLNSLRTLPPDTAHTILVCFAPHKGEIFQEVLKVVTPTSTLHITLAGKGVNPVINLSVENGVFDVGSVIATEYREETFTISNSSALSIQYAIKLDSQSLLRHNKAQGIPGFLDNGSDQQPHVGTQNNNGQNVFDCVPAVGAIPPGSSKEVVITFAPDHPSDFYSDYLHIELFGQEEMHSFRLVGEAKPRIMFMSGGDELVPDIESLSVLPAMDSEEGEPAKLETPMLVTMHSVAKDDEFTTASRDIYVGCVRTMAVSQKKNGEWYFDNIQPLINMGFNIDPIKGMIEAGTKKPITITWTPPSGYDAYYRKCLGDPTKPNKPMSASINCTVKGDVAEVYKIMIRAFVVSD